MKATASVCGCEYAAELLLNTNSCVCLCVARVVGKETDRAVLCRRAGRVGGCDSTGNRETPIIIIIYCTWLAMIAFVAL